MWVHRFAVIGGSDHGRRAVCRAALGRRGRTGVLTVRDKCLLFGDRGREKAEPRSLRASTGRGRREGGDWSLL